MSAVVFYGASDDLIEVEGDVPGCDEYNAEAAGFVVVCRDGSGCVVRVSYTDAGTWHVGASPIGENVPMPDTAFLNGEGHTARLAIGDVAHVTRTSA